MIMNRLRQCILLIAVLCICVANPALSGEVSHLLDGKTFVGKNGEKGRELDPFEDEEIIFQNGRFRSVSCEPYNFGSGEYLAEVVGKTIHFKALTESPTHGKIAWQGIVDGDTAEVTFVWTKERWYWNIHREYWFRGALRN